MSKGLSSVKKTITHNAVNLLGWRTQKRIIVIESDDWGSIRMPSEKVYSGFISRGYNLSSSDYNRIDTIESNKDLEMLLELLLSITTKSGQHPVLTANMIVGNPDFKRIKASGFMEYYFESSINTLKRYPNREKVEKLWKQGNAEGVFHPQFHGREHVNIVRWMNALREGNPDVMFSFDNETTFSGNGDYNFMEVLDYNSPDDLPQMRESIAEGLDLFEQLFGYKSTSFIPPCYTWSSELEKTLANKEVRYIQGLVIQSVPTGSFGHYRSKYHFLGQQNKLGQRYLIRNCFFEPSLSKAGDPVDDCLSRINIAFRWHKPAIISSHRINFIGSLDEDNRSKNLKLFKQLLTRIINTWPDVIFMTSDQLGDLISVKARA